MGICIGVFGASNANGQLALSPSERMAGIVRSYPCRKYPFAISLFRQDESFRPQACALVGLSLHEIAAGRGRLIGLVPGDTARVTRAVADNQHVRCFDSTGTIRTPRCDEAFWSVTFQLRDRGPTVRVFVNESDGHVSIENSEALPPLRVTKPRVDLHSRLAARWVDAFFK